MTSKDTRSRRTSQRNNKCQQKVIRREMRQWKRSKLTSGRSKKRVTNYKQAIAIALNVARSKCGHRTPSRTTKRRTRRRV